jgi:hypothetical protein
MRDGQPQRREVAEQVGLQQLHECRGVGVEVVRTGGVACLPLSGLRTI